MVIFMDGVHILWPMEISMLDSGLMTRNTEKAPTSGQVATNTKAPTSMVTVAKKVNTPGQTAVFTKEAGRTVNDMDTVFIPIRMGNSIRRSGTWRVGFPRWI